VEMMPLDRWLSCLEKLVDRMALIGAEQSAGEPSVGERVVSYQVLKSTCLQNYELHDEPAEIVFDITEIRLSYAKGNPARASRITVLCGEEVKYDGRVFYARDAVIEPIMSISTRESMTRVPNKHGSYSTKTSFHMKLYITQAYDDKLEFKVTRTRRVLETWDDNDEKKAGSESTYFIMDYTAEHPEQP
jgi:hypothetical protein